MSATLVQESAQTMLIATFEVAGTLCGIDAMKVQEVVRIGRITRVHHAPERIVGIINLRGKILTVLDLGEALELGRLTPGPESRVFVIESQGEYIGLLTDHARDVVSCNPGDISPPPANIHGIQGRFFEGVYQAQSRLIAILNMQAVLTEQDSER